MVNMEAVVPLLDGENVLDSEVLIEANMRKKALQRIIYGSLTIVIGIIGLIMIVDYGEGAFYGGYGLIIIGAVLIVSGVLYLKETSSYGIVITNFRLIEQYIYQNAPAKVIDHHYEFFESTEVPFHHTQRPKSALLIALIGFLIIIGAIIAFVMEYPLPLEEYYFPYILGGLLTILGLLIFFLGGEKTAVIPFQITKTSRNILHFTFSVRKLTEERIYAIINQIILASREFINKTAI
jgi:hypothetical protein